MHGGSWSFPKFVIKCRSKWRNAVEGPSVLMPQFGTFSIWFTCKSFMYLSSHGHPPSPQAEWGCSLQQKCFFLLSLSGSAFPRSRLRKGKSRNKGIGSLLLPLHFTAVVAVLQVTLHLLYITLPSKANIASALSEFIQAALESLASKLLRCMCIVVLRACSAWCAKAQWTAIILEFCKRCLRVSQHVWLDCGELTREQWALRQRSEAQEPRLCEKPILRKSILLKSTTKLRKKAAEQRTSRVCRVRPCPRET